MQLQKPNSGVSFYSDLIKAIGTDRKERGTALTNTTLATNVASMESLSDSDREATAAGVNNVSKALSEVIGRVQLSFKKPGDVSMEAFAGLDLTETQRQAGAIAAAAYGAPDQYLRGATSGSKYTGPSMEGRKVFEPAMFGSFGAMDYTTANVSQEAYDTTELNKHAEKSIVFNMYASRQDAAAELLFKTSVHTPDEAGVKVGVNNIFVINELRHNLTGTPADLKRKNLLRAFSDASILEGELTRLYPVYVAAGGNANTSHYVSSAVVAPFDVTVAGETFQTAPLSVGADHDLLGLSQTAGLLQAGVMDVTDALDARLALDKVYVSFTVGGTTKVVAFDVNRLTRAAFYKSAESNEREMTLTFRGRSVLFTADTEYTDGTAATGAAGLVAGSNKIRIALELTGTADTQTGTVRVDAAKVQVVSLLNASNQSVSFASGAGQTLVNGIGTMAIVGYTLEARRTNTNRRTRGILVDTNRYEEMYKTYLGSPIACIKPTGAEADALLTQALVAVNYARNTNQAITRLLNNAEHMQAIAPMFGNPDEEAPVEGIGRLVVKPYYYNETIDVAANVNSISTHERHDDIRELFGNILRRAVYDMYYESSYQPALEMISGGTAGKPHVAIITDPVTQKYLYTTGDARFLGDAFDFTVVSNLDSRLKGKIFMTFVRPNENGVDILSYGNFIWIPELITMLDMVRNGQISKELGVQPRTLHMVNLPILVEFAVTNLEAATNEKTKAPVTV